MFLEPPCHTYLPFLAPLRQFLHDRSEADTTPVEMQPMFESQPYSDTPRLIKASVNRTSLASGFGRVRIGGSFGCAGLHARERPPTQVAKGVTKNTPRSSTPA